MANRTLLPKIFTAAALAFAAAAAARATQFELVAGGKARAQLFVDGKASFAAAKELRKYVAAMTGVELEYVREGEKLDPALGTVYFGRPRPGTPRQAWLNYHDERNMNHKQTEM